MSEYGLKAAETRLPTLIDAALAGEEAVIAAGSGRSVRLVPIGRSGFKLGLLAGKVGDPPDFLEPMSEEDLRLWEGG